MLAAIDRLKIFCFRTFQNILMTCWLLGERSLPFRLLVVYVCFFSFLIGGSTSTTLQYVAKQLYTSEACDKMGYGQEYGEGTITEDMLCGGEEGKDACQVL